MKKIGPLLLSLLLIGPAYAASTSYQATLGSGAGFAAWCVGGSGAPCTGGVFWPGTVIANSSGAELFTSSNAGFVQGAAAAFVDGADVTQGAKGDSAATDSTSSWSLVSLLKGILAAIKGSIPAGSSLIGKVGIDQTTDGTTNGVRLTSVYPAGATPITNSATGTTGATTATLAGTSGKTTYICGYSIRANATAAATVMDTITGLINGTLSSVLWVAPLASGLGVDENTFIPCLPAIGTNQAIAVVSGAPGSGGTVSSRAWGYQQ